MPHVSVVTPTHLPRYLDDAHRSLQSQTMTDWEWVVLLNGEAEWAPESPDARIRIIRHGEVAGVGDAKHVANGHARGSILVELDHDDLFHPNALERVASAFDANPDAALVYSHAASVDAAGAPQFTQYNADMGWTYDSTELDGVAHTYPVAFPPTPHNVSYIWFAPNHVRAFRREIYEAVGGHDREPADRRRPRPHVPALSGRPLHPDRRMPLLPADP